MEIDYPAAHSMDTQWFAVDKNGCIAIMESYEPGAVPELFLNTLPDEDAGASLLEEISAVTGAHLEVVDDMPKAESIGLFQYECAEDFSADGEEEPNNDALPLYERMAIPAKPLTISDLPADLAGKVQLIKFDRISFAESHLVQPIDFMRCVIWGKYDSCYDSGGTVVPIPKEHVVLPNELQAAPKSQRQQQSKPDNRPWWQKLLGGF